MIKLDSDIFKESSKSLTEHSLPGHLIRFIVVFIVIMLLESIIPSLIAVPKMIAELDVQGLIQDNGKISMNDSVQVAMGVSAASGVMIPSLFSTIFGTLTSIIYCRVAEVRNFRSMGVKKKGFFLHYGAGILFGTVLMSSIVLLSVLTGINSIAVSKELDMKIFLLYFAGWIIQGMSEEFIFRGYLMTTIGGHYNKWLAVGISSVAFALAHIMNPGISVLAFIDLTIYGLFAALYMVYTENIWGCCAIHSFWNFLQGNFYGISVSGTAASNSVFVTTSKTSHAFLSGGGFGIEGSLLTTLILGAGCIILCLLISRKEKAAAPENS